MMRDLPWFADPERLKTPEDDDLLPPVHAGLSALDYLQSVYRDPTQPEHRRMRAAKEALPYENPKLHAVAHLNRGEGFNAKLERAIQRSNVTHLTAIEAESQPTLAQKVEAAKQIAAPNSARRFDRRF